VVDLQNLKQPCTQSMEQYYDKFSIGIVTGKGRTPWAARLIRQLNIVLPNMPVGIVVNLYDEQDLERMSKVKVDSSIWTDEIKQLPWCKNQLAIMYPDKPYIIWLNDDLVLTHPRAIDTLIWAHLEYKVDFVRGWINNGCMSMFKGALAKVLWWDERYWYDREDCDFHFRMAHHGIGTARYVGDSIFAHHHCTVDNYGPAGKCNGRAVHKDKWGLIEISEPTEPGSYPPKQLQPDIDYYPEFTEKFLKMERIHE